MVAVISVSNLLALRGARSSELAELKKKWWKLWWIGSDTSCYGPA